MTDRKKAVRKADKAMSNYIRARDPICYCGKPSDQNGHFFSRRYYATRWDEDNCLACCSACNFLHNTNPEPMRRAIVARIGEERLAEMEELTKGPSGLKTSDILDIAEMYKKKLEESCV